MSEEIPLIRRTKQKISPTGGILELNELVVKGVSLEECKKKFDEIWKEE